MNKCMIIDQECDVNIFIMGILYPKTMCTPNCHVVLDSRSLFVWIYEDFI